MRTALGRLALIAVAPLVLLGPTGCAGCKADCESTVQFSLGEVMRTVPAGSVATVCVGATCETLAPDQETATVYLTDDQDDASKADTKVSIRNRRDEVVFDRTAAVELKAHKPGRFCGVACRTGAMSFRP